jgi:uncharacterized OB-fold protein
MDTECKKCGRVYQLRENCEPTPFCDACAQEQINQLERELNETRALIAKTVNDELSTSDMQRMEQIAAAMPNSYWVEVSRSILFHGFVFISSKRFWP